MEIDEQAAAPLANFDLQLLKPARPAPTINKLSE